MLLPSKAHRVVVLVAVQGRESGSLSLLLDRMAYRRVPLEAPRGERPSVHTMGPRVDKSSQDEI
jgi:hypothetical protein